MSEEYKWPIPCGISVPQVFTETDVDIEFVRAFVKDAEALGYHSLWVQERIIGTANQLEPINLLSFLSGITKTIRLGTAVIVATTRNPFVLAKELTTLDHLSDGRLTLGLALGGNPSTYQLLGAPESHRVRHFMESLNIIKDFWTQERVSREGTFWNFRELSMMPMPVQKPRPPIWLGGRHPDALKRSVRHADGWMGAGSTSSKEFASHVKIVHDEMARLNVKPSDFHISKRCYIAIDDDEQRAESRLADWFGAHYGNSEMASHVSVFGSIDKCANGLQEIIDAGAQMLMLNPVFDQMEHLHSLKEEVIPLLKSASSRSVGH
jgi:probable F420-dependent oxidoreductase